MDQLCLHDGLAPITAEFSAGRLNVLLGRNGAGKTRLCRLLAGLDPPPSGIITLGGHDVTKVGARQRGVAMVYQDFVNYPSLNVRDNIASPMVAAKVGKRERDARVRTLAEQLAIEDQLDKRPGELSGGQQQRLAIARALAKNASVILLDEPLANLDLKLRDALRTDLKTWFQQTGTTVVYATSDPSEAFEIADTVYLMHGGVVIQSGHMLDVYRHPASRRAADLLSDPGVNEVDVRRVLRPEHIRLTQTSPDDLRVAAVVELAETDGSNTYLHVVVDGRSWVARLAGLHHFDPGDDVTLYASTSDLLEVA